MLYRISRAGIRAGLGFWPFGPLWHKSQFFWRHLEEMAQALAQSSRRKVFPAFPGAHRTLRNSHFFGQLPLGPPSFIASFWEQIVLLFILHWNSFITS